MSGRGGGDRRRVGGLFVRREAWVLSGLGRLVLVGVVTACVVGFMVGVHPFLAMSDGGKAEVLVVEGWISTRRTEQAAETFLRGRYQTVVVVRDIYSNGDKWSSGRYSADYVAADLVEQGVPKTVVHTLFCPVVRKDRTYHCALAVREWLQLSGTAVRSIDVATVGTHTRRSRLLYQKAFGSAVRIGSIALDDPTYDPQHWWRSSAGVRDVLSEAIAYGYVRFFFWPGAAADQSESTSPPAAQSQLPAR